MKRVLLTLFGTVAGLVALLSFKISQPQATTGALPSAGLPADTGSSSASTATGSAPGVNRTSSAAPSNAAKSNSAKSDTATTPSGSMTAASRSYLGSAVTTRYGVVQVKITVSGTHITNVSFAQLTAFDQHSQDINAQAAPQLLQETLTAQSAHIDTVSGASYTSDGYEQSLQRALDSAGIA